MLTILWFQLLEFEGFQHSPEYLGDLDKTKHLKTSPSLGLCPYYYITTVMIYH